MFNPAKTKLLVALCVVLVLLTGNACADSLTFVLDAELFDHWLVVSRVMVLILDQTLIVDNKASVAHSTGLLLEIQGFNTTHLDSQEALEDKSLQTGIREPCPKPMDIQRLVKVIRKTLDA